MTSTDVEFIHSSNEDSHVSGPTEISQDICMFPFLAEWVILIDPVLPNRPRRSNTYILLHKQQVQSGALEKDNAEHKEFNNQMVL